MFDNAASAALFAAGWSHGRGVRLGFVCRRLDVGVLQSEVLLAELQAFRHRSFTDPSSILAVPVIALTALPAIVCRGGRTLSEHCRA